MTTGHGVSDYIKLARDAIIAGQLDEAETYTQQAKAIKAIDDLTPKVDAALRPVFGTDATDQNDTVKNYAMKAWYAKTYGGALDGDVATVMRDIYGGDYMSLRHAKSADFLRYIRTGRTDPKLEKLLVYTPEQVLAELATGMSVAEIKATQIEAMDSLGGYLVPEDFRDNIVTRMAGLTQMRKVADSITTSRDRVTMPVSDGGDSRYTGAVRVVKVDESPTSTAAATQATFSQTTIPVYTFMGHVAVSKNLIDDSAGASAITPYLQKQFADAYAIYEDEQFLVGNGVAGPQGILKDATTGGPYTFSYGAVTTVNSGAATGLTGDSIRNLPYGIDTQYRQAGGYWMMSRGSVRVMKTLKDGSGAYLWADRNQQLMLGQPAKLEGYDILETETLASPTTTSGSTYTANVYPILFVTKGSYLIVDKAGGLSVDRYDDSTTAKANSIVLVMRRRVGGQVILPWGISAMKIST